MANQQNEGQRGGQGGQQGDRQQGGQRQGGGGQQQQIETEDGEGLTRAELLQRIIEIIQSNVDADGWRDNGGDTGAIQELNGNLIITNTAKNHRQISGLLRQLREVRSIQINVETRFLLVNENFQTAVPHIYAVGDIIGFPALASAAYVQGRAAATHIVTGRCDQLARDIPAGIYTSPEISSLGKTERQLTEEGVPYEIGHAQFKHLARAQITGQTVGMLKLLFNRDTLQILGIH